MLVDEGDVTALLGQADGPGEGMESGTDGAGSKSSTQPPLVLPGEVGE